MAAIVIDVGGLSGGLDKFWKEVGDHLVAGGVTPLFLCSDTDVEAIGGHLAIPWLRIYQSFRLRPERQYEREQCDRLGSQIQDQILARFAEWNLRVPDDAPGYIGAVSEFVRSLIDSLAPVCWIHWNGCWPWHLIADQVLREKNVSVLYAERGMVPGFVHLDPKGVLVNSKLAETTLDGSRITEIGRAMASQCTDFYRNSGTTWWKQADGKEFASWKHGAAGKPVALFAGQVDADTQNFLFSPCFGSNVEAWRWFCGELAGAGVAVYGKHHPMSPSPVADYRDGIPAGFHWSAEGDVRRLLRDVDLVASVNSTVNIEALLEGKVPLGVGGRSLVTGKGIIFETSPDRSGEENSRNVESWVRQEGGLARLSRWEEFLGVALQEFLFSTDSHAGFNGAGEFAAKVLSYVDDSSNEPKRDAPNESAEAVSHAFQRAFPLKSCRPSLFGRLRGKFDALLGRS